ncbi:MAG: DUF1653 domain-containing protein [Clostridiales bacterium]|nr:DUF1653 domain-containing protein [Clostridiales bacterium]
MLPSIEWLDKKLQELAGTSDPSARASIEAKIVTDLQAYSEADWNDLAKVVEEKEPEWNLLLIPCLKQVICQEAVLQLSVLSQAENDTVRHAAADAVVDYAGFSKGKYRHYKGNCYEVIGVGRSTENKDWMVVYQGLQPPYRIWVRPASMWLEIVGDGVHRFEKMKE